MGQLVFQATLGGQVSLVGPNTASTISINIPATNGNMVTTGDTGTVTNTMLANSAITFGSTSQALGSTISAINGVSIGASTAGTGAFTTLTASTSVISPVHGAASGSSLSLQSNGTTNATLDTSGNLGLGVTPSSYETSSGSLYISNQIITSAASGAATIGYNATSNNKYVSTGYASQYYQLNGTHVWRTAASGTAGNAITFTQAMTLNASGQLLVGTTTPYDVNSIATFSNSNHGMSAVTTTTSGGWYAIECGRTSSTGKFIGFTYPGPGTEVGSVSYNGTLTLYNQTSDQRLKENIVDAGTALETIEQIKIRSFDWIESKVHETHGVIAQELKEIAPQCVTEGITNEDGSMGSPWQVDTSPLVPMLIKAIQELSAKVTALETQLGAK